MTAQEYDHLCNMPETAPKGPMWDWDDEVDCPQCEKEEGLEYRI